MLRALIHDRRRVVPLLGLVIAVGVILVVILTSGPSRGSSPAVAAPSGPTARARASTMVKVLPKPARKTVRISIRRFLYHAGTVTIRRGTRVQWTNEDRSEHTATDEGKFDTDILRKGAARTITFRKAGTYDYICALHPFMRGRVLVR